MPRIRTIKPDFWDSPDTASADLRSRLLYIAMWNWADDYGIGDATPLRLIGFAFPNDPIPASDYPRLLADVSDAFGIVFFEHLGRRYYVIPAWDEHQRTEKKAKPKEGLLEAAQAAISAAKDRDPEPPRNVSENPPPSDGESDAGSRKGKWEREDKEPPYPPDDESPPTYARKTGAALVRSNISKLPARSPAAHQIAQAFSDSLPSPIPSKVLAEMGSEIDQCLNDGISPHAIADGMREWAASDSWSPTQIQRFIAKAAARPNVVGKPTRKALDYADAAEALIAELETIA